MSSIKLKQLVGVPASGPVFVIGTGRSGTHWLGYSLGSHPEVSATIEAAPMFRLSTRMALNSTLEDRLFWRLIFAYKWQVIKASPRIYLDKSHPNIWIAEKLKAVFPGALFLGIERNPYATVASMIKHRGIMAWHRNWRQYPLPNRFLGITEDMANEYQTLPIASQCAIRWLAHHMRMNELKRTLGESLLFIQYESFANDTATTIINLQQFLGLKNPIPTPEVRVESLSKWKSQLSDEQVAQIQNIVGIHPPA